MSTHACTEDQLVVQPVVDRLALVTRGWVTFQMKGAGESGFTERLLQFANELGTPAATRSGSGLCDVLSPTEASAAKLLSLSRLHAVGEFPLHSDTAHWMTPCRHILLACVSSGSGNRPTLLMDTHQLPLSERQATLLHSTPLRVTNGRNSFFSTIMSKSRPYVRFDPGCMTATTREGVAALSVLSRHNWPGLIDEIRWTPGTVLVMDNWRILHGRAKSSVPDLDRKLLRISIR